MVNKLRMLHVKASSKYREEEPISPDDMICTCQELTRDMNGPNIDFKKELNDFISKYAERLNAIHKKIKYNSDRELLVVEKQLERLTLSQMVEFADTCKEKYM